MVWVITNLALPHILLPLWLPTGTLRSPWRSPGTGTALRVQLVLPPSAAKDSPSPLQGAGFSFRRILRLVRAAAVSCLALLPSGIAAAKPRLIFLLW